MPYLSWDETTITDFSEKNVAAMYERGYVFTRVGRGAMRQTRSCRIDLAEFELSSENRRILKRTEGLELATGALPLMEASYDWRLGKLAKDFYDAKFGRGTMSAQKIKEMLVDPAQSNFNLLLRYNISVITTGKKGSSPLGYAICYKNPELLHYSYPFYDLAASPHDTGLGMMIRAIEYSKNAGARYAYLGSLQRPTDTYKLRFAGLEWFDGGPNGTGVWRTDIALLKEILK